MRRYFSLRWRGQIDAAVLFWRDIVVAGTVINLIATFGALMVVAQGGSSGLAVLLHFAPLPYNVFLVLCLWRAPGRTLGSDCGQPRMARCDHGCMRPGTFQGLSSLRPTTVEPPF